MSMKKNHQLYNIVIGYKSSQNARAYRGRAFAEVAPPNDKLSARG
jgi:hypothetical protein